MYGKWDFWSSCSIIFSPATKKKYYMKSVRSHLANVSKYLRHAKCVAVSEVPSFIPRCDLKNILVERRTFHETNQTLISVNLN